MLYQWVKTLVGAALAANFSFPLITVLINRPLWEEPMAVLAGNMSLTCTLFGLCVMLIGVYDLADLQSVALCRSLEYCSMGFGVAFKAAQVCVAVDQYVAVMHPLQHYSIMVRSRPLLFAGTWFTCLVQLILGLAAHFIDLETFAERAVRLGGNSTYAGCRWETGLAYFSSLFIELEMVVFSIITASLLLHTGVVGHRIKIRLMREVRDLRQNNSNKTFFDNYRAFKRILAVLCGEGNHASHSRNGRPTIGASGGGWLSVEDFWLQLSLTVVLDIVAPILRIYSRWNPQPKLNGLVHMMRILCFIFEGWAYGLLNAKLRSAYRKIICGKSSPVERREVGGNTTAPGNREVLATVAVPELQSVTSGADGVGLSGQWSGLRCRYLLSVLWRRSPEREPVPSRVPRPNDPSSDPERCGWKLVKLLHDTTGTHHWSKLITDQWVRRVETNGLWFASQETLNGAAVQEGVWRRTPTPKDKFFA
ncbi:hypothetical protein FJT64_008948 [Amphibalanus amphitrite]|uniref:G-protein coupled receptors family 1 profile domain-containing protein n=1 Tax=Amphibalanus amphitrite TaxID=1232801 RepID=A0A6A4VFB5_AMPAM|nr:hypothetical protein FJT64_008948 [Amphibalanus amphitrite]